ncbi:MAG: hypothetical protein JNK28_07540 [Burkholderiaceae bacterium]|nr:hypothetical protein [Burkholderiaceae bacterium]
MSPEARARQTIDALLTQAGWHVCNVADANIHAARGVAIREFPLNPGHGFADYLLYIDAKAAGVIEAKKEGATLTGVEVQSTRYAQGLPASLPAWRRPLPFSQIAFRRPTDRSRDAGAETGRLATASHQWTAWFI